jgi:hypothetical protein
LVQEAARVAPTVFLEVPLEASLSGRRASRRALSQSIGHIQALDRRAARRLVEDAGLHADDELMDPLPAAVHLFGAETRAERLSARARAAARQALFAASPALAARLFTVHYACVCTRS